MASGSCVSGGDVDPGNGGERGLRDRAGVRASVTSQRSLRGYGHDDRHDYARAHVQERREHDHADVARPSVTKGQGP